MPNTLTFRAHCYEESCDLGGVEYTCPACGKDDTDYDDLWWKRDEYVQPGGWIDFCCSSCARRIVAFYEDGDMVLYDAVQVRKDWWEGAVDSGADLRYLLRKIQKTTPPGAELRKDNIVEVQLISRIGTPLGTAEVLKDATEGGLARRVLIVENVKGEVHRCFEPTEDKLVYKEVDFEEIKITPREAPKKV